MSQELPEKIPLKFRKIGKSFRFSGYSLDPYKLEMSYDIRLTNEKFLNQQVAERISEFVKTKIKDRRYHGSRIESYGNRVSFISRPKSRKKEDGLSYYRVEFIPGYFLDSGSLKVVY